MVIIKQQCHRPIIRLGLMNRGSNSVAKNSNLNRLDQQQRQNVLSTNGTKNLTESQQVSNHASSTNDQTVAQNRNATLSKTETQEIARILEPGHWHINIHTMHYQFKTSKWFNVKEYQFDYNRPDKLIRDDTVQNFNLRLTNDALRREFQEVHQDEKVLMPDGETKTETFHINHAKYGDALVLFRYFKLIEKNLSLSADELAQIFESFATCFRNCCDIDVEGTDQIKKLCQTLDDHALIINGKSSNDAANRLNQFQTKLEELTKKYRYPSAPELPQSGFRFDFLPYT